MKKKNSKLIKNIKEKFGQEILSVEESFEMVTLEISSSKLIHVCKTLKEEKVFDFVQLIDLAGIDYFSYGHEEWETKKVTTSGFSRGRNINKKNPKKNRFAVVYHLLSINNNHRIRLKCYADHNEPPCIPSVNNIWNSANWFEREAFDLFGIFFIGHNDLRRILTDYGFIGHPFRKDFPLIGEMEVRYDFKQKRIIYDPVSITERTLVPRVIRKDNRYK
jgi:NADH-quinone oxidoreductase subunit C